MLLALITVASAGSGGVTSADGRWYAREDAAWDLWTHQRYPLDTAACPQPHPDAVSPEGVVRRRPASASDAPRTTPSTPDRMRR